jgi:hypothetical protein
MEELTVMTSRWWVRPLHVMLGSLVMAVGAWLAWDALSLSWVVLLAVAAVGFLSWQGSTIGLTWAWTTLFLGLESLTWPFVTMYQIRQSTAEPNDDQMGMILSAVWVGLFSAVFWISFSYGLFKRTARERSDQPVTVLAPQPFTRTERQRKKR